MCAGVAAACTPLASLLYRSEHGPVVVASPPPPPPNRAPYSGPHPSTIAFDLSRFSFPVAIGEVGPIDVSLGPLQYPFACDAEGSELGEPIVDNQDGLGTPVHAIDDTKGIIGYSLDCGVSTRAEYYYKPIQKKRLFRLKQPRLPDDIEWISSGDRRIPFVVRVERGSINRFLYAIAVLADPEDALDRPNPRYWNGRLIYYFRGGVGVGHRQGEVRASTATTGRVRELAKGYAIAFSSGTHTANHYNVWLAANTASMVKAQFEALYGKPRFTIGIGESGGAVQQLLIAQNRPGLLDALIPVYSFPDMITQTIWALDCELLEYYFDITAAGQSRWRAQEERSLVLGLAADSNAKNPYANLDAWARLASFHLPRLPRGATECSKSWRGLAPLVNNPTYTNHPDRYAPAVRSQTHFSHWDDLTNIYGSDAGGHALRTYDNVGVQYGLEALRHGDLAPAEFLHLNANVGGWKPPADQRPERYWLISGDPDLRRASLWSAHNMTKTPDGPAPLASFESNDANAVRVAPRTRGDLAAIQAAYWSGHVFLGHVDLPIVDVRHYLDPALDMHHSFASLSTRARIEREVGAHNGYVIWMSERPYDPSSAAVDLVDRWLTTGVRPDAAVDTCWDADGRMIAVGRNVWDGAWNGAARTGPCLARYPPYKSPRNVAGAPLAGDIFKCALIGVDDALRAGVYAPIDMQPYRPVLERVFPDGVCDYRQGDVGRPTALLTAFASP